jgi:hypothetical protein
MQLLTFPNEREYIKTQKKADEAKSKRTSVTENEMNRVLEKLLHCQSGIFAEYPAMIEGVCHGCRNGQEIDFLNRENAITCGGTDLFERNRPEICIQDFRFEVLKWKDRFDFIYSNSLDHSDDPVQTLFVWSEQLKSNGVLLLQWSTSHRYALDADCFGASLDEYLVLVSKSFNILDLLWIGDNCCKVIIVAERKNK